MIVTVIALLFMPACAALAGLLLWLLRRREDLTDGQLVAQFTFFVVLAAALAFGFARTDFVRLRLNPQLKVERALDNHPVYLAVSHAMPEYGGKLRAYVMGRLAGGESLDVALVEARPMLTRMVKARLGFADAAGHIDWGRATLGTLSTLQKYDVDKCYEAVSAQALDAQTLLHALGPDDNAAFQDAVVEVFDSSTRRAPAGSSAPVVFNDGMREYDAIRQQLSAEYGAAVSELVARNQFPPSPQAPTAQICAARIAQLNEILRQPQPMAAFLVDVALR